MEIVYGGQQVMESLLHRSHLWRWRPLTFKRHTPFLPRASGHSLAGRRLVETGKFRL